MRNRLHELNPDALIIEGASPLFVDDPEAIRGKRVLVIEDGPTLTHGEHGLWRRLGGSPPLWRSRNRRSPPVCGRCDHSHLRQISQSTGAILPAMGYGDEMTKDLETTINNAMWTWSSRPPRSI